MDIDDALHQLAEAAGGTIGEVTRLPDGSGVAATQLLLPVKHWSVVDPDMPNVPPMGLRLGTDHPRHRELVEQLQAAGRYAYRAATMNGKRPDLDPDALVQSLIVGLFGYWTHNGTSDDLWSNPDPLPPIAAI